MYRVPLNAYDTSLTLNARAVWSEIVEAPFDDLDIESEAQTFGVAIAHPVYRSLAL